MIFDVLNRNGGIYDILIKSDTYMSDYIFFTSKVKFICLYAAMLY